MLQCIVAPRSAYGKVDNYMNCGCWKLLLVLLLLLSVSSTVSPFSVHAAPDSLIGIVLEEREKNPGVIQGIEEALVIIEDPGETGISVLLALYKASTFPPIVGPIGVLTGRLTQFIGALQFSLVAKSPVSKKNAESRFTFVSAENLAKGTVQRMPPGAKRHGMYLRDSSLQSLLSSLQGSTVLFPSVPRGEPLNGITTERVEMLLGKQAEERLFSYDAKRNVYRRTAVAGNMHGAFTNVLTLIPGEQNTYESGDFFLLHNKKISRGTWEQSQNGTFLLKNQSGKAIALAPGQTWVVLAEEEDSILYQSDEEEIAAGQIRTGDKTPVLIAELKPDRIYSVMIMDVEGVMLERGIMRTDEAGVLLYQPNDVLPEGEYRVHIRDQRGFDTSLYDLHITQEMTSMKPWIVAFGRKGEETLKMDEEGNVIVGGVERAPGQVIQGYVKPGETVIAEFHSIQKIEKVTADSRGYFELPIPTEIGLGEHTARLVYLSADSTIARDLLFSFSLLPSAFDVANFDASLLPWHVRYAGLLMPLFTLSLLLNLFLVGFSHARWGHFQWLRPSLAFAPAFVPATDEFALQER